MGERAAAVALRGSSGGASKVMPFSSFAAAICKFSSFWLSERSVVVIDPCPSRSRTWASGTPRSTRREAFSCRRSCQRRLILRKLESETQLDVAQKMHGVEMVKQLVEKRAALD